MFSSKDIKTKQKIEFFFSSLFDRVLWDKSNEPCPAFVRYRYPIEITPQILYFSYFSRETAVQESLMAPFFGQKCPNHVVFEGLQHLFAGRQEGESGFDVSLKYWKMSTKVKNDSVTNCFYATSI